MNTKTTRAAHETVQLHLVNAIARAIASDAHGEYLRAPARVPFKRTGNAQAGRRRRDESTPEQAAALLGLLEEAGTLDPRRLASDPRRVLPYLVTVSPLIATSATGTQVSVLGGQLPLEPLDAPEAWAALRENPRIPVTVKEGRWRWRDWVTPELRAHWLALAAALPAQVQEVPVVRKSA